MQKVIFVVDDNDINLSVAREALKEHYRVITLPSAAKMLSIIEKIKPDLILLDIYMPETDGFKALEILKSSGDYADIPVIFLTGTTDDLIEADILKQGVIDIIKKPFSAHFLQNKVSAHLNKENQQEINPL